MSVQPLGTKPKAFDLSCRRSDHRATTTSLTTTLQLPSMCMRACMSDCNIKLYNVYVGTVIDYYPSMSVFPR